MNFKRGIFRVWIILSILWAGGAITAVVISGDYERWADSDYVRPKVQRAFDEIARRISLCPPAEKKSNTGEGANLQSSGLEPAEKDMVGLCSEEYKNQMANGPPGLSQWERWEKFMEFAAMLIIPPGLLLGFIYVFSWVVRGFAKD